MTRLKPKPNEFVAYTKAKLHYGNEKRSSPVSIDINKATCEYYIKSTFPFRLAGILKSLGKKVIPQNKAEVKDMVLKEVEGKQGNQRRLKDLYKYTAIAMNNGNNE